MDSIQLGKSRLQVSKICFGTLTMGPLQANLSHREGGALLKYAYEQGIGFLDTAELYQTYGHIKESLKGSSKLPVIATKSYAYSKEQAKKSIEKARKEMNIDVIDLFMLHEQESIHTLKGHQQALEYYIQQKQKGIIKAIGVSTHYASVVDVVADMDEIDVIHPIFNVKGIGIADGSRQDMEKAVKKAHQKNKGIFSMKPLGGGSLINDYQAALAYVKEHPHVHSVAIGMQSKSEVDRNLAFFGGKPVSKTLLEEMALHQRKLHIEFWCCKCKKCIDRCGQKALGCDNGKIVVDQDRCVLCGYCISVCPEFAIKIF